MNAGTPSFAAGWRQVGAGFVLLGCMAMIGSTYGAIAVPLAAILAVLALPAALQIVNHPADKGLNPDGAASPPEVMTGTAAQPRQVQVSALKIVTDPSFWMLAALVATVSSAMKGLVTNLAPLAIDEGIGPSDAAYLVSIFAGCSFVAKLIFASIADRFSPKVLLLIVLTGCACAMLALTRAEAGYATIAAGVALLGIFGGFIVLMAVPPLFGWTFDRTGNYDLILLIFAVLAVLAMLAVPWLRLQPRANAGPVLAPA